MISETTQNDPNSLNGGVTYTWDEVGNRTGRTSTLPPAAGVTNQAFSNMYDVADRFINHSFDDNGSTLGADGRTYTYDTRRRLTRVQGSGLDVSYTYDSDGNLVQKIDAVAGVTTKYVFDSQNATGFSQTLEEIVNGTPKVRYTYGNRLISRAEWNGSQWQRRFYQFDGEGNVAFLTDETGSITDSYTYADGRVIRHDGPSANEFLMKGERVDPATGLVFLRARWLDPNYERFMTRDKFEGNLFEPLSRHKYIFAGGDSVNKSDPSGHQYDLCSMMMAGAIAGLVFSIPSVTAGSTPTFEPNVIVEKALYECAPYGVNIQLGALTKNGKSKYKNYRWVSKVTLNVDWIDRSVKVPDQDGVFDFLKIPANTEFYDGTPPNIKPGYYWTDDQEDHYKNYKAFNGKTYETVFEDGPALPEYEFGTLQDAYSLNANTYLVGVRSYSDTKPVALIKIHWGFTYYKNQNDVKKVPLEITKARGENVF